MKIHIPNRHQRLGNAYGYSRMVDEFRQALRAAGAYTEDERVADALVHIAPPYLFVPRAGMLNIVFTMFEAEIVPWEYRIACRRADLVVVPSAHNRRIFARAGIPSQVCPLGVNVEQFPMVLRKRPAEGDIFRYLWVGAPNPRKGWPILDRVWREHFSGRAGVELYVKTTAPRGTVTRCGNIVADCRQLSDYELAILYASAHCFVFPSFGEGFGLTLAEAMATGLPAVFTPYGGVCDFASEANAYPVKAGIAPVEYFGRNFAAMADQRNLARTMNYVRRDYTAALQKGKKAAEQIRKQLTWSRAAVRLVEIVSAAVDCDGASSAKIAVHS